MGKLDNDDGAKETDRSSKVSVGFLFPVRLESSSDSCSSPSAEDSLLKNTDKSPVNPVLYLS